MVGVAFSTGLHFGVNDVLEVTLVHKDVVQEMPMFAPSMHSVCLPFCWKNGVGDDKLLLRAKP